MIKERQRRFLVLAIVVAVAGCAVAQSASGKGDSAVEREQRTYPIPTNLKVLPKEMTGQQVHDMMERWAGDLGVRCNACHDDEEENVVSGALPRSRFADDSKPMKSIARVMYTMTDSINTRFIAKTENSGMPVTCGTCHQGRINPESGPFLITAEPSGGRSLKGEPCFQCHEDKRAAFSLPFRHKVEEGLISCTDCHEPHGTSGRKRRRTPAEDNLICMKCHAETAGPFAYEHAAVKAEGCMACHVPHGGPNPEMLNRAKVDTICLLCHLPSRISPTGAPVNQAHDLGTQLQPCTACHADIHGSNVSTYFLTAK